MLSGVVLLCPGIEPGTLGSQIYRSNDWFNIGQQSNIKEVIYLIVVKLSLSLK